MTSQKNNKIKFRQCACKWGSECQKLHRIIASYDTEDVRVQDCMVIDLTSTSEKIMLWKNAIVRNLGIDTKINRNRKK